MSYKTYLIPVYSAFIAGFITLLSGCSPSEPPKQQDQPVENVKEEVPADQTQSVDYINQKMNVVEVPMPESVNLSEGELLQPEGTFGNDFYFQILDRSVSALFPTVEELILDPVSENLQVVETLDPVENRRVTNFREVNGDLYQCIAYVSDENKLCMDIIVNGNIIDTEYISNIATVAGFTVINGKVVMYSDFLDENGSPVMKLLEISQDQVNTLYSFSPTGTALSPTENMALTSTLMQDDCTYICFSNLENGQPILYTYDGNELNQFPLTGTPFANIPLTDGVLLEYRTMEDGVFTASFDFVSLSDGSIYPVQSGQKDPIGEFCVLKDNSFIFADSSRMARIARISDEQMTTRDVDGLPSGILDFNKLEDGQIFIYSEIPSDTNPGKLDYGLYLLNFES